MSSAPVGWQEQLRALKNDQFSVYETQSGGWAEPGVGRPLSRLANIHRILLLLGLLLYYSQSHYTPPCQYPHKVDALYKLKLG